MRLAAHRVLIRSVQGVVRNPIIQPALVGGAASEGVEAMVDPVEPVSPDPRRGADRDDLPPSGHEARARGRATTMPLVWAVLGLLVVVAFVALLGLRLGYGPSPVPANPPAAPSPSSAPAPVGPAPVKAS